MLRGAVRRLLAIVAVVVGGTAAISVILGALAGKNLLRSLALGFYVVGAAVLVVCFLLGSRGPLRREAADPDDVATDAWRRRRTRKATPEERWEARRGSLGLFAFGIVLVLIGAAVDPTRRAF